MKKKNIAIILIAVIAVTFVIGAIISHKPTVKEEECIQEVITSFLAGDYIWDEPPEEEKGGKLVNPTYIEIYYYKNESFYVIFPIHEEPEHYIFYAPKYNGKPTNLFVDTPASSEMENVDYSEQLLSICKSLKSGTCYLKVSESAVLISNIRIARDGTLYVLDTAEEWHKNVKVEDFILA